MQTILLKIIQLYAPTSKCRKKDKQETTKKKKKSESNFKIADNVNTVRNVTIINKVNIVRDH